MARYLFRKEGLVGSIPSTGSGFGVVCGRRIDMRRSGFTLIELIIVVTIIGITATLVLGLVTGHR
jgi:prepilin-type N-terminal cleavage/methylation domain-containing protein